jgi:hypothetical protein
MAAVIKLGEVGSPDPSSGGEEELSFQNYSLEMMEAVGGLLSRPGAFCTLKMECRSEKNALRR